MSINGALLCLALAVYYEARGESYTGKAAVAHVVLNRKKSAQYPSDTCAVVFQKGQFSWTANQKRSPPRGNAWYESVQVARAALTGAVADPTRGAKYFHTIQSVPKWAYRLQGPTVIGNHVFYKGKMR